MTGATGFVGRAFCAAAAQAGLAVIAIGRDAQALSDLPKRVEARRVDDLCDQKQALEALRGADIVLHLADRADRLDTAISASPSLHLAEAVATAARSLKLDALVFASSIYATLDQQGRSNRYGSAKLAAERVVLGSGIPSIVLRLPPIYGRGEKGGVAALASLTRRGLPLPFGAADAKRDYLYVGNLTDLLLAVATAPSATLRTASGHRFEPSDGTPIATAELIRLIGQAQGRKARLLAVPPGLILAGARILGLEDRVGAAFEPLSAEGNEALGRMFGWTPGRTMPETLAYLAEP